jgi:formylglycine-generating enzyme required for sulfatase activity
MKEEVREGLRERARLIRVAAFTALMMHVYGSLAVAGSEATVPVAGTTFRDCPDCPEMVVIPAGTYLIGSSSSDSERDLAAMNGFNRLFARGYLSNEHPQHRVRIGPAFGLGRYLVTRAQFAAFVRATGYSSAGGCIFYRLLRYTYHDDGSWQNPGFQQAE